MCRSTVLSLLLVVWEIQPLFAADDALVRQVGHIETLTDLGGGTIASSYVDKAQEIAPSFPLSLGTDVVCPVDEGNIFNGACGETTCDANCSGACNHGCTPKHRVSVYGAFLYLRPRDADVAYGVPVNGPIIGPPANNPIQVGAVGIVDPDYDAGFYAGLNFACDKCASIDVRYTMFENTTHDRVGTGPPNVIRSLVAHPSSISAASDFLRASAELEIDFDLIDAAYRRLWCAGPQYAVHYAWGGRYAQLDQRFASRFVNNGVENVVTDIDFDGGGIRLGVEAERFSCHSQWSIFARGYASFLAGRFRADYTQTQAFDPLVVDTAWEAGRVVSILDVELGMGWTSFDQRWRLTGSYNFSSWLNAVKTEEFINAVQVNDFDHLDDRLTFDGLQAHIEYRF